MVRLLVDNSFRLTSSMVAYQYYLEAEEQSRRLKAERVRIESASDAKAL